MVREFEAGVTEVDDDHIDEFLRFTEGDYQRSVADLDAASRAKLFELHRERSIHVHCWAEHDFQPVIDYSITMLDHRWEFIDGILTDDEGPEGIEFGYVMRRSDVEVANEVRVERFHTTRASWAAVRHQVHAVQAALAETQLALGGANQALAEARGALAHMDGVLTDTQKLLAQRSNLGRHVVTDARRAARRAKRELAQRRTPNE